MHRYSLYNHITSQDFLSFLGPTQMTSCLSKDSLWFSFKLCLVFMLCRFSFSVHVGAFITENWIFSHDVFTICCLPSCGQIGISQRRSCSEDTNNFISRVKSRCPSVQPNYYWITVRANNSRSSILIRWTFDSSSVREPASSKKQITKLIQQNYWLVHFLSHILLSCQNLMPTLPTMQSLPCLGMLGSFGVLLLVIWQM